MTAADDPIVRLIQHSPISDERKTELLGEWHQRLECCDLHNSNCEPPSELCCWDCTEANHPDHPAGERCTWLDAAPADENEKVSLPVVGVGSFSDQAEAENWLAEHAAPADETGGAS